MKKTDVAINKLKVPTIAASNAVAAWMMIARYGVLYFAWTLAKTRGNNPSTAKAYPSLDVPIIPDSSDPVTEIKGAFLEDFRLTDDGFRFVLNLQAGYQVLTDTNGLGVAGLPAGAYLVTYGSGFHVQPLTPPHIILLPGDLSLDPPASKQMAWTTFRATLHNAGLRDVTSLPVRIYAAGDICLKYKFTHTADATARIVIQNALFLGRKKQSALTIPWCTYTDPEIHAAESAEIQKTLARVAPFCVSVLRCGPAEQLGGKQGMVPYLLCQ
jgi:hypothetical protein